MLPVVTRDWRGFSHAADKTTLGRLPATGIGEHSAVRRLTVQRRSTQHRHTRPADHYTPHGKYITGTVRAFHEEARAARIRGGTGIHNALKRRRPRACRFEPCRMHQPHTSRSHSSPTVSARDDRPHCNAAVGATDYHPCRKQGPPKVAPHFHAPPPSPGGGHLAPPLRPRPPTGDGHPSRRAPSPRGKGDPLKHPHLARVRGAPQRGGACYDQSAADRIATAFAAGVRDYRYLTHRDREVEANKSASNSARNRQQRNELPDLRC